jgi:hypothetical protein
MPGYFSGHLLLQQKREITNKNMQKRSPNKALEQAICFAKLQFKDSKISF